MGGRLPNGGASSQWGPAMPEQAELGIGAVYSELLQPHRAAQVDFLKAVVHQFSAPCSPINTRTSLPNVRCGWTQRAHQAAGPAERCISWLAQIGSLT